MNVKCPNCRFKFEVNPNNELNCTCPRCGKSFVALALEPVPASPPVQAANREPVAGPAQPQSQPKVSEVDLYYSAMRCMEQDLIDKARAYVTQLLQMNPNEPLYIQLKESLDQADEAKRSKEERIRTMYFLAMKCIDSAQFDQATEYINSLLAVSPNDPMYQNLWNRLIEKQNLEAQRQEELRRQDEARWLEEERRREETRLEDERRLQEAWLEAERKLQKERFFGYLEADEYDKAKSQLDQLLEENPDDPVYLGLKKRLEEYRLNDLRQKEILRRAEEELKEEERKGKDEASEHLKQVLNGENYEMQKQSLGGSGSGCMVVILAVIVTLASFALF